MENAVACISDTEAGKYDQPIYFLYQNCPVLAYLNTPSEPEYLK